MKGRTYLVELGDEQATIYTIPNSKNYYLNYTSPSGERTRPSLRTDDLDAARERAEAFLRERMRMKWGAGEYIDPLRATLRQLADLYFEEHAPTLSDKASSDRARAVDRLAAVLGWDFQVRNFDRSALTRYEAALREGLRYQRVLSSASDDEHRWVEGKPAGQKTIFNQASDIRAIWKWGLGKVVDGEYLIEDDPFNRMKFIGKGRLNPRQATNQERFEEMMRVADRVDPTGRLSLMILIARRTGRRRGSICKLRVGDLLLTRDEMQAAVEKWGAHPEIPDIWKDGAIMWDAEFDKESVGSMTPVPPDLRSPIDSYVTRLPQVVEMFGGDPSAIRPDSPLFPAEQNPESPIPEGTASEIFRRIREAAGLEAIEGSKWHGFRHLFRSERHHFQNKLVGIISGWFSFEGSEDAMNRIYLDDPIGVYEVACFQRESRHSSSQRDGESA